MTAYEPATPAPSPVQNETRANARWLAQATAPWKKPARLAAALVIADVIPAVGFAAGLGIAMQALAQAAPLDRIHTLGLKETLALVWPGALLAVLSLLVRAALALAAGLAGATAAAHIKSGLRKRLWKGAFAGRLTDSAVMAATVEGIDTLDGYTARFLPVRRAAAVSPLLLIGAAALVSPFTAGIFVFTLLPFIIGMILTGMAAGAESRRQFIAMERLSGLFIDRARALPAILSFQAEVSQSRHIARAANELALRTSRVLKVAFLSSAILEFFSALAVALVAVYCGFNLLRLLPFPAPDALTLGQAFFLLALAPEVYQPMRRLAAAYHDRQAAEGAVPHLKALEEAALPDELVRVPAAHAAPPIRMENVCIEYHPGHPVVSGFNLQVPAGGVIAFVGPSGSGKSSLLHLFLGLSPLCGGRVTVGDTELADDTDLTEWMAYAGQAPMVIRGTLGENIAIGHPTAGRDAIRRAALIAGLSDDLDRIIDERGGGLSGGERRRLGLARAFLKPAPVLLLDEPTAHLDAASEKAMLPVLKKAAAGRTTLIATHSDAVAALADMVVHL